MPAGPCASVVSSDSSVRLSPYTSTGGANAAKRIKVEDIGEEVKALSKQYPLRIPPWFGLIVRTFSALEGLGLGLDSQYSIVNQVRSLQSASLLAWRIITICLLAYLRRVYLRIIHTVLPLPQPPSLDGR